MPILFDNISDIISHYFSKNDQLFLYLHSILHFAQKTIKDKRVYNLKTISFLWKIIKIQIINTLK